MPPEWTQQFDFYVGMLDGSPTLISLDLEAVNHVPVSAYPVAMTVRVPMKHPNEMGLRSDEDLDELVAIEDTLVPAIVNGVDAIHWGRYITQGRTDFHFYLKTEARAAVADLLGSLTEVEGYALQTGFADDPNWVRYADSFPSSYHRQTMWNRHVQTQLEAQGDRLAKRRRVDHFAWFETAEGARAAAQQLKRKKFAVRRGVRDETGRFGLPFHRKDSCDNLRPDEITAEILDSIEPSGGVYDGWGTLVQK